MSAFLTSLPQWNPHEYQLRGIKLLLSQGATGLFLDPGLGKTSIILAAFKILKSKGFAKRMLIIAPLRPCYKVWPDEIHKWENFKDLTFSILHGKNKQKALEASADIYIINPDGLEWLFSQPQAVMPQLAVPNFDILCIDESTQFKDSTTKRFRLIKPLLETFRYRWILTGTPAPNGLEDLFGQMYILDQGRSLGRYITHFRNQFFQRSGYNLYAWKPRPGAFTEVIEKISPLILQLSAEDYLKMPEIINQSISVDLPGTAQKIYKDVENEFISVMEGESIVAANAAVAGVKCRQIANGAIYNADRSFKLLHSEKLDALDDIIAELNGAPVLVLYEFKHDKDRILSRYPDAVSIDSGMSPKALDVCLTRFNSGGVKILLGHPASMGHGLNMQGACNNIIWFGIPWSLELYDQAVARVYRQGQKAERVFVRHLVAKDTLDEKVMNVLTSKDRNQQKLLAALAAKQVDLQNS